MTASTVIIGPLVIDFTASTSSNQVQLDGIFSDIFGVVRGGSGTESVSLSADATNMGLVLRLNDGDDTLDLNEGTELTSLFADFGSGTDQFIDDFFQSSYPFGVTVLNLP